MRNLDFASLHLGRGLRPIGLYGNPLPEASFLPRVPANPGTAHCQRGKKRPSHLRAKGECLAVPPFLTEALDALPEANIYSRQNR